MKQVFFLHEQVMIAIANKVFNLKNVQLVHFFEDFWKFGLKFEEFEVQSVYDLVRSNNFDLRIAVPET